MWAPELGRYESPSKTPRPHFSGFVGTLRILVPTGGHGSLSRLKWRILPAWAYKALKDDKFCKERRERANKPVVRSGKWPLEREEMEMQSKAHLTSEDSGEVQMERLAPGSQRQRSLPQNRWKGGKRVHARRNVTKGV